VGFGRQNEKDREKSKARKSVARPRLRRLSSIQPVTPSDPKTRNRHEKGAVGKSSVSGEDGRGGFHALGRWGGEVEEEEEEEEEEETLVVGELEGEGGHDLGGEWGGCYALGGELEVGKEVGGGEEVEGKTVTFEAAEADMTHLQNVLADVMDVC
jgi:hypothetical protein